MLVLCSLIPVVVEWVPVLTYASILKLIDLTNRKLANVSTTPELSKDTDISSEIRLFSRPKKKKKHEMN